MNVNSVLARPASSWGEPELASLFDAPAEAHDEICVAADELTRRRHGNVVTYVVNRNLNFTNVCSVRCHFCAYHVNSTKSDEAYWLTVEEAVARVNETPWVTEVCIQGGINDAVPLRYYEDLLRGLRAWKPSVHLHAFSPQEIVSLAKRDTLSIAEVLSALRAAGLDSIPGTAAEILVNEVRRRVSPHRLTAEEWCEVVETAHGLGLRSSATMMFGHVETTADRVHHLQTVRSIQERTGGFTEFVPMPFMQENTAMSRAQMVAGGEVTNPLVERVIAVSRLYLDDVVPNVQTSWVKNGLDLAARTLRTGANDLGGTLYEENITKSAGGQHGERMAPEDFRRVAEMAGRTAVERDTLYQAVPDGRSRISELV